MALKIIKCEESSISCFLRKVKEEAHGPVSSLENCKNNRKTSIVLGKIIKIIDSKAQEKCVKILVREILPDATYGIKFKAVIQDTLALLVMNASLRTGDRLGFLEPQVYNNPTFKSDQDIKYILQIGGNSKPSLMWYAKKQYILAQFNTPSKGSTNKVQEKELSSNEVDSIRNKSPDMRQKPQIHLPVNPQIPSNTQKLNPRYVYKNLSQVKSDALLGDLRRVNIIAVVSEITKGLSKTTNGKYTIICKIVDDSAGVPGELINFDLHFFTPEATVIKEIDRGDILRLHRVKMELYLNDVDGRVFHSQDVIVFKKNAPDLTPITITKNFSLTDEDKRKILALKKWYKEEYGSCLNSLVKDISLLSEIQEEGEYCILCKVVSEPLVEGSKVTFSVTDGSVMKGRGPRPSPELPSKYNLTGVWPGHLVTDIEVFERIDEYSKLKVNDFVFLRSVRALKTINLHLAITTFSYPMVLDLKVDKVSIAESRLKAWETKIQSRNIKDKDSGGVEVEVPNEIQEVQGIQPINNKEDSEQVSNDPQMPNQEMIVTRSKTVRSNQSTSSEVMTPVVKLVRLNNEGENKRKSNINETESNEDLENASTVVNLTLENDENKRQINKRLRLDSDSPVNRLRRSTDKNSRDTLTIPHEVITHKVSDWLIHHDSKDSEDLDLATVRNLLVNQEDNEEVSDLSSFISSHIRRLQVFLRSVVPDPSKEPLDLVSGYCEDGCRQLFLFSTILWKEVDNQLIPSCPSCHKSQLDRNLVLMFMLQLNVMDRNGNHDAVVICREHGETFFGCSVKEFVMDFAIRRSRVQLLLDNSIHHQSRPNSSSYPFLDISLVSIANIFCAVNTKLKLPPNP